MLAVFHSRILHSFMALKEDGQDVGGICWWSASGCDSVRRSSTGMASFSNTQSMQVLEGVCDACPSFWDRMYLAASWMSLSVQSQALCKHATHWGSRTLKELLDFAHS
jgi:hypothetical protein